MSYAQTTQAALASAVLGALNDPGAVYWSTDEVNRAINEALLTWGDAVVRAHAGVRQRRELAVARVLIVLETDAHVPAQTYDRWYERQIVAAERRREPVASDALDHFEIRFEALDSRRQAKVLFHPAKVELENQRFGQKALIEED